MDETTTWIALLRGINVGGKNKLPMASLIPEIEKVGLRPVRSYLQSGNLVFCGPRCSDLDLAATIRDLIRVRHQLEIPVLVAGKDEFLAAARANPFPDAEGEADGRALHLFFLETAPGTIDTQRLNSLQSTRESWRVVGRVFYLHAPEGFHISKLAAGVERTLGIRATARNWRTVCQIREIAGSFP